MREFMAAHKFISIGGGLLIALAVSIPLVFGRLHTGLDTEQDLAWKPPDRLIEAPLTLKLVTFNIQDLMLVSSHRPERMRAIGAVLSALDPDIVGFQESFIEKDRRLLIDGLKAGSRLQHHRYYPSRISGSGLLISSAFPIKGASFRQFTQSNPFYKITEGDWWAGKGVALARIELPQSGGSLDFYNTHAQADYKNADYQTVRLSQMADLVGFMNETRSHAAPAFLVGDMNCRPGSKDYQTAVQGADLARLMTLDSEIDHIFGANTPRYRYTVLDTVQIRQRIDNGQTTFELSDHIGYMSTIRISCSACRTASSSKNGR